MLPFEINRWAYLAKLPPTIIPKDIPFASTGIVLFLFDLSGLINVLLFLFTRPNLLLLGRRHHPVSTSVNVTAVEELSFGHGPNGTVINADRFKDREKGKEKEGAGVRERHNDLPPEVPPLPPSVRFSHDV